MKLLISLVALLLVSACAGVQARENVLMPAMKTAWSGVSKNVKQGIDMSLSIGQITPVEAADLRSAITAMGAALESGQMKRVADVNWHRLNLLAKIGIEGRADRDEIGPIVKKILLQRLEKFHSAYVALIRGI